MKHLVLDIFKAWILTLEQNRASMNQELNLSKDGKEELNRFIKSLSTRPKDEGGVRFVSGSSVNPKTMNEDYITIYGYNFKITKQ